MESGDVFKCRIDLMRAYCDTAKSYIQLSTGALVLPLVFTQTIYGKHSGENGLGAQGIPLSLIACWGSFLLSVGCGVLYQWLAIRAFGQPGGYPLSRALIGRVFMVRWLVSFSPGLWVSFGSRRAEFDKKKQG
jgi:hypothetical protein